VIELMDIAAFLGRLHPVVVHLPIGFILMAAAFDLISYSARFRHLRHAVAPALFAGFIFAVIACAFGYLLSLSGSYDEDILVSHRNAGIALAIASAIWCALASGLASGYVALSNRMMTLFGFVVVLVLSFTGHQGGSLTHGRDYLSFSEPDKPKRAQPLTVAQALVFDDVVLPILERRCEGCHRRGKRKGDLVVSTYADLMKGGKDGVVIVAGNLAKSELYRRITLDPDDKDFMPTDGKKPLTNEETDIIKWWIEKAHATGDAKLVSIAGHEQMIPTVAAVLGLENSIDNGIATVSNHQPNADIPMSTDMAAVGKLRRKGVMVRVMLHAPVMLDVTLPANSGTVMKDLQNDLRVVSKNIVWLNLSRNNLTTKDLLVLKEMRNLEKLRLERNPVGDDLVDVVKDLKHLEALNINETNVTDAGYARLQQHSSLKRIYRWSPKTASTK
jgi:uncharacterized membrane protein